MRRFMSNIEDVLKRQRRDIGIKQIELRFGLDINVYDQNKDVHSKVYGTTSGESDDILLFTTIGLVTKDDFFPLDSAASGGFQEGWLYTSDHERIVPGQTVEFRYQGDTRSRKYKVMFKEGMGQTTEVFPRFRLSALGG